MHGQQNVKFINESSVTRSHLFVFPVLCIQTAVPLYDPNDLVRLTSATYLVSGIESSYHKLTERQIEECIMICFTVFYLVHFVVL